MTDRAVTFLELKAVLERSRRATTDGTVVDADAAMEQLAWIAGEAPAAPRVDEQALSRRLGDLSIGVRREALELAAHICLEVAETARPGSNAERAARLCAARIEDSIR